MIVYYKSDVIIVIISYQTVEQFIKKYNKTLYYICMTKVRYLKPVDLSPKVITLSNPYMTHMYSMKILLNTSTPLYLNTVFSLTLMSDLVSCLVFSTMSLWKYGWKR